MSICLLYFSVEYLILGFEIIISRIFSLFIEEKISSMKNKLDDKEHDNTLIEEANKKHKQEIEAQRAEGRAVQPSFPACHRSAGKHHADLCRQA